MSTAKHSDAYKPPQKTSGGFNGYQVVSAMQKCTRRGLEKDALFWATELWASCNHEGREYIWHRLRVIASEDVGLADNNVCVQVSALYANFTRRPNEQIFLWHAVLLLTRAPKSRIVDHAGIGPKDHGCQNRVDQTLFASEVFAQIHPAIHACHLVAVAVEH